ncbi:S8 family serine peptidase [Chryseomicrobium sp. FSL W7-1435]|uniref:S8 family peptidase n=1 Tax=Chryseomicrobium sp. FSL W7-1435 TaxID=2921704 RepID=UPI00315AA4A7
MKHSLTLSLLIALTGLSTTAFAAPAETTEPEKVFISFDEEIDYTYLETIGATVTTELPAISTVIASIDPENTSSIFQTATDEVAITPYPEDDLFYLAAETPSWGYEPVLAGRAYTLGYRGNGIKVGVIDSGINGLHPDLRVKGGTSFVNGSHLSDFTGHGTHVAGIIAAQANTIGVRGVAPAVDLYSIRVFGESGIATNDNVLEGIQWAIDNEMQVINMSFVNGGDIPKLREILQVAHEKGIILVAASGNGWDTQKIIPSDVQYPAKYPFVMAVGSIGKNESIYYSSFRGPSQEFVAPGEKIYSTFSDRLTTTDADYKEDTGTSMATPFVTGIAAQYLQAYPHLTPAQIRLAMQRNAKDLGAAGRDATYGYGLIQSIKEPAGLYPDTKSGAWYSEAIERGFEEKIISGFPDGTFRPSGFLTRAEAVSLLSRALNWPTTSTTSYFRDVPTESFAFPAIGYAYEQQIITGVSSTRFVPQSSVTRGDLALMLHKALQLPVVASQSFPDVDSNAHYAEAVQVMVANEIIVGYPEDQTFRPKQPVTRAEFTSMIFRALYEEK